MALEIAILGRVEVRLDGDLLRVPPGKQCALLTLLALHAPEPIAAEVAADALWPRTAPSESLRSLHVTVSRLRRSLGRAGAALETTASGYRLALDADAIDARRFEALLRGVAEPSTLEAALALWRGRALADVEYESFAQGEIARLEELRLVAQEQLIDQRLSQGEHAQVVAELERLATAHPSREQLTRMLMLALYRSGRQAEALDVYQRSRRRLDEELGLEPTPALRHLQAQILRQDPQLEGLAPTLGTATLSPGQTLDGPPSVSEPKAAPLRRGARLPVPPTSTVGRSEELARLESLATDSGVQLVSVVGPAGVGKTRVAVELARALAGGVADGAYFVSLAALTSAEHVPSTILRAVGVGEVPGLSSEDAVVAHCATRAMLLVLDNFEHVMDAARFVSDLLAAAPRLTVIVTSREPLHIRAEHVFTLAPLAVPSGMATQELIPEAAPALQLFTGVARARRPDFELSGSDVPVACDICRRLDGLPLAIELAAGSLGALTLRGLADRLSRGLDGLAPGPRDAPARQRTVRATLQWSYQLLDDAERAAFEATSVFAGGFTLDAAEAVADVDVDVLQSLVDKQLITAEELDGEIRFNLLQTIREFGAERLDKRSDATAVRRRHLEHYLAFAEDVSAELRRTWSLDLIEPELDNVRAALAFASQAPAPEQALRLLTAIADYLAFYSTEAIGWFDAALSLPHDDTPANVRADAFAAYAYLEQHSSWATVENVARESLRLYEELDEAAGLARGHTVLSYVLDKQARPEAYAHALRALEFARQSDDPVLVCHALSRAGLAAPTQQESARYINEKNALHRAWGNWRAVVGGHGSLAYMAIASGDYDEAEHQLAAARQLNAGRDRIVEAGLAGNAGLIALFTGHLESAARAFLEELAIVRDLPMPEYHSEALQGLAAVSASIGEYSLAATLLGAAGSVGDAQPPAAIDARLAEEFFNVARTRAGSRAWQEACASGGLMSAAQAADLALDAIPPILEHAAEPVRD